MLQFSTFKRKRTNCFARNDGKYMSFYTKVNCWGAENVRKKNCQNQCGLLLLVFTFSKAMQFIKITFFFKVIILIIVQNFLLCWWIHFVDSARFMPNIMKKTAIFTNRSKPVCNLFPSRKWRVSPPFAGPQNSFITFFSA